ncbi:MAG: zf-HC2 domain-containing protein [Cyanobacteria bacterium P01_A01_bin.40]
MTSKFDDFEQHKSTDSLEAETELPNDCFELLSAYLDGELSPADKNQVQQWLDQDPKIKHLYTQLLALQSNMQRSVAPPSTKSVAEITAGVFNSINNHRRRRRLAWCGSAVAASILASLTGMIPGLSPLGLEVAQEQYPSKGDSPSSVMLAVAVNKPAINIPKGITGYEVELQNSVEN